MLFYRRYMMKRMAFKMRRAICTLLARRKGEQARRKHRRGIKRVALTLTQ
jgi:hypothetical protein